MKNVEPITFTLSKNSNNTLAFREWDIIKSMGGKKAYRYDIVKHVEIQEPGQYTLTMHPLNISKWKWIAKLELYILRKCLKK